MATQSKFLVLIYGFTSIMKISYSVLIQKSSEQLGDLLSYSRKITKKLYCSVCKNLATFSEKKHTGTLQDPIVNFRKA